MNFQVHSCDICGERFRVTCFSELEEKLRKHKCPNVNKRVERTKQLQQAKIDQFVSDTTVNRIEEHNFDQLIEQGIIVAV